MGQREIGSPGHPQSHRFKCPGEGSPSCPLQGHHLEKVPPPVPPHEPLLATATTSLLHRGAIDLEVGPLTPRGCPGPHPLFDLSSHGHECLLDVGSVLGTRLQEGDAQRVCKLLGGGVVHHLLGGEVALVAHQQLIDILAGVAVNLLEPLLHVGIGFLVCDVVYHDDAVSPPVVAGSDGPEPFLTSCVPDLKLDGFAVQLNGSDLEVHPDGADVALCVCVVSKP